MYEKSKQEINSENTGSAMSSTSNVWVHRRALGTSEAKNAPKVESTWRLVLNIAPKVSIYQVSIVSFDLSYRTCLAPHPLVSLCFSCWHWTNASMYQVSGIQIVSNCHYCCVGIVSTSFCLSVSYRLVSVVCRYRIEQFLLLVGIVSNSINAYRCHIEQFLYIGIVWIFFLYIGRVPNSIFVRYPTKLSRANNDYFGRTKQPGLLD